MLDIADILVKDADKCINLLPDECRRAVWSKVKINMAIGKLIRRNPCYEYRASPTIFEKIRIALQCVYFTSLALQNERGKRKVWVVTVTILAYTDWVNCTKNRTATTTSNTGTDNPEEQPKNLSIQHSVKENNSFSKRFLRGFSEWQLSTIVHSSCSDSDFDLLCHFIIIWWLKKIIAELKKNYTNFIFRILIYMFL